MATYRVIAWREIPAIVEARDDAGQVSVELSERFHALIDSIAMQHGLDAADAYLEDWHSGPEAQRPGSAREVGTAIAAELEARFAEFVGRAFGRP